MGLGHMQKIGRICRGVFEGGAGKNFSSTPISGPPKGFGAYKIVSLGGLKGAYLVSKFDAPPLKTGVRGGANVFKKFQNFKMGQFRGEPYRRACTSDGRFLH